MKLVTFDYDRVGYIEGDEIVRKDSYWKIVEP